MSYISESLGIKQFYEAAVKGGFAGCEWGFKDGGRTLELAGPQPEQAQDRAGL